jgi:hypothetical protein
MEKIKEVGSDRLRISDLTEHALVENEPAAL